MSNPEERYAAFLDEIFTLKAHFGYHKKQGYLSVEEKLERMEACGHYLDKLAPGWQELKVFHVAGSSGKGTTAMLLSGALSTRFKVGTLLSPHVFDVTERIQVNLKPVPREFLIEFWEREFRPEVEKNAGNELFIPSLPELMLICAARYFLDQGVDYVVLETGLGGRYDQTTLFSPLACLVTTVSLDHTHILGDSVEKIAWEKGGIIKPDVPFFTSEDKEEALRVFRDICHELEAPFHQVLPEKTPFKIQLPPRLDTSFNRQNALLAAVCLNKVLGLEEEALEQGSVCVRMPGRFEIRGNTVLDIAHNQAELMALAFALQTRFLARPLCVVIGMADKKRHRAMLEAFSPLARAGSLSTLYFTRAGYRGVSPGFLKELAENIPELKGVRKQCFDDPTEAYQAALQQAGEEGLVVVTGSTFLVDAIFNPSAGLKKVNMGKQSR